MKPNSISDRLAGGAGRKTASTATVSFDTIFCEAVEIADTAARAEFLTAACGTDEQLRHQLDELIAAHFEAGDFLIDPPARPSANAFGAASPGTFIGPYKILERLGEGGCGVVYLAEQQQPLRRQVALKVIRPGMDTRQVIARFESERQSLALMNHPNIAPLYDAGATALGSPYFVMELVRGTSITDYCEQHKLSIRRRLELFIDVCHAVQHAHQKGIIHRDLKPSNILIATDDSKPLVKVIDFGIAKAIGGQSNDITPVTGFTGFFGTPLYTSPEQAQRGGRDMDTRSDVYSLGVLLYELLTGRPPFRGDSVSAILRAIVEDAPTPPRRIQPAIARDLSDITLKCLEKKTSRRYSSASNLEDDVRRFLAYEPILARPAGVARRMRLWTKRKPAVASLLLIIGLLSAAIGIGGVIAAAAFRQQRDVADGRLWEALVAQADTIRLSHRPGQHFASLDRLQEAIALAKKLELPPASFGRMRNAAITALALPDICPGSPRIDWPPDTQGVDFPERLDIYARSDLGGTCFVRRVADDTVLHKLAGLSPQFSRDGKFLALNQVGGGVNIWRLGDGAPVQVVENPKLAFRAFHPAGTHAACFGVDGAIDVYALASGERIFSLTASETGRDPTVAFHPTEPVLAVTSYYSTEVRIWDWQSRRLVGSFVPDPRNGNYFPAWDPAGKVLAIPGGDRDEVKLYEHGSWKLIRTAAAAGNGSSIAFNPPGDRMLVRGWGGFTRLIDVDTGRPLFTTPLYLVPASPRFNSAGAVAAAVIQDGKLADLRVADGRVYRKLVHMGPEAAVNHACLAISPNGRLLAVGTLTGLGIWELESGAEMAFIRGSGKLPVGYVAFESASSLLTNGISGVWRWPIRADESAPARIRMGPPERLLSLPGSSQTVVASANGQAIAIASRIFGPNAHANSGAWVQHIDRPLQPVRFARGEDVSWVAISPDACLAATVTHEIGRVDVWDAVTGAHIRQLKAKGEYSGICQFTANGRHLLGTDRQWETSTWAEEVRVSGLRSPDGRLVAQFENSRIIRLLRAGDGAELARLEAPELETLVQYQFTPDSTKLVAGAVSGVHVWDLRELRTRLSEIGLDWDEPPYPPAVTAEPIADVTVYGREAFADPGIMDLRDRLHLGLAIAANPLDGGAYYQLARMEAANGSNEQAFALLSVAGRLIPDYMPALEMRASIGRKLGRWHDVISDSTRVLSGEPSNLLMRFVRGMAYRRTGRPADAVADLSAALKIAPSAMIAYLERADAYIALGQPNEASADERSAAEVAVDLEALNSLVWQLVAGPPANRNPKRALVLMSKHVRAISRIHNYLKTMGVAQYRNGLYREAVATLNRSMEIGNGELAAYDLFFLAMSHAKLRDRVKAQDCFDRAIRWLDGKPKLLPHHIVELAELRAEAEEQLGRQPDGD